MRGISFVSVYFFYSSMSCYTLLRYFREAVLVNQSNQPVFFIESAGEPQGCGGVSTSSQNGLRSNTQSC